MRTHPRRSAGRANSELVIYRYTIERILKNLIHSLIHMVTRVHRLQPADWSQQKWFGTWYIDNLSEDPKNFASHRFLCRLSLTCAE